jgi:hypothetical protein
MSNPGYTSTIFSVIRQMAGRDGLKLARSLEKDTYKLEAHHRHLKFTHRALDNCWFPKSLRFNPPGKHKIFRQIMERASKHCMRARISICHERINFVKKRIHTTTQELAAILPQPMFNSLHEFLKQRMVRVRDTINTRHEKKLDNMRKDYNQHTNIDRSNWVINLSKKPLTNAERSLLEKGPKFAITPSSIPYKNIVSEVEAAIHELPDETKDIIRTNTASILDRARLPQHKNISTEERKALSKLKKDHTRIVMKADKGNSLVVMDRSDYDSKMENLLQDETTYTVIRKSPFKKVERDLNAMLLSLKNQGKLLEKTYRKLHSSDAIPPAIRGSIKHHKANHPLRPIVTSIDSALYNTSKFLSRILSPLQNQNGFSVTNSTQFRNEISNMTISEDETMVSFDVVSLFTAIPVDKACSYIRNKLENDDTLSDRTQLDIDDILRLLEFVLSNSFFVYNDKTYKQIHGCAMGSPVSAIVANLCMEVIEEQAIQSATTRPKTWKRFVDDSFAIINKNAITNFHDTLNSVDPHIKFTIEHEKDGQIAFLDTLVSRRNNSISIDVYRKPTHTDRYLDYASHHDMKHKISTATTLIHRSLNLPTTEDSKSEELKHVSVALASNGYPKTVISKVIKTQTEKTAVPSPEELVKTFFELVEPSETCIGYATLPYIKGITEPLSRTLRKHNIKVCNKPLRTLQREFPSVKHRPPAEEQTNIIYKIPCKDCPWNYIGETGRSFKTRKSEHIRNVKHNKSGSNVAKHSWDI